MTEKEIKEEVDKLTTAAIKSVIDGEKRSVSLMYARPDEIIEIADSMGLTFQDDFDTNGWSWDYWFSMENDKGEKFSAHGDGYYSGGGNFLKE